MLFRACLTGLLVVLIAACSRPADPPAPPPDEGADAQRPAAPRTTFVHLFEWSWPAIAAECEAFLGPGGFSAVQVSPPQEHATGPEWYTRYQPVSYRLESRGGSRDEFIDMVERCKAVDVDIYVDAVINHMTGVRPDAVGVAGTAYGEYDYPPLYDYDDFNHCGRHGDDDIRDYDDPWEVQNCELVNLADLKTDSPKVQETLAAYLNELLGLGVAGFRIDAAKHMPPEDVAEIMAMVGPEYYVFQEVLDQGNGPIDRNAYLDIGALTEFQYEYRVADAFRDGKLERLRNLGAVDNMLASDDAVVFVDNHDSQRSGHVLTYKDGQRYLLANVFMLAHPYGYPKLMSSFRFSERDQAPPDVEPVSTETGNCVEAWVCEHRMPELVAMVEFRNAMHGEEMVHWQEHEGGTLSFGRGAVGHVALNTSAEPVEIDVTTSLQPGNYCNVLSGIGNVDGCDAVVVADGRFTATLPPLGGVVIRAD